MAVSSESECSLFGNISNRVSNVASPESSDFLGHDYVNHHRMTKIFDENNEVLRLRRRTYQRHIKDCKQRAVLSSIVGLYG
ncbi:hypothetical protein FHU10_0556 [Serratia fonticola]|uniref:Uncharacterized protein n=1 Tax=Serratia fonticola TaxID=47917 RepID=A0A542BLA3_SERFO|nr:hypothetical protein FHU09_1894 [Serratia fonticola]TQI98609.1 hypothetical protein FHU11_4154 [Serratia fonticola]TVZ68137.1 hypothetical protein FHU10_0556 [Serratia fonticola]